VVPFTEGDQLLIEYFVKLASFTLERGKQTREMILRMIEMSKLRDPHETGNHVKRVSAYAIEIYESWARKNNRSDDDIKHVKDSLRIAAMMHDVGKVAISDLILKKPGKLDPAEYEVMKEHTVLGARLFVNKTGSEDAGSFSKLDLLSADVAMNHHERWDGAGYPGKMENPNRDPIQFGSGKKGAETHWAGRIVALADVYDALIMRRVYKDPWPEEKVKEYIRSESGKQFDPEIVQAFFSVYETIERIRKKYADEDPEHS
jgi:response regulator RpfG family c-di-GMP phosphodiesterase